MINKCNIYFSHHRINFQPTKCFYSYTNYPTTNPRPAIPTVQAWDTGKEYQVTHLPDYKAFRYLGVYFTLNKNWQEQTNLLDTKLTEMLTNMEGAMANGSIPPERICHIIDTSIIPAITYVTRVANIPLNTILRWSSQIRRAALHMHGCAQTLPTIFATGPTEKWGLNIPSLIETTRELRIDDLLHRLNHTNAAIQTAVLGQRRRLQAELGLPYCPLERPITHTPTVKNTLMGATLEHMDHLGISIQNQRQTRTSYTTKDDTHIADVIHAITPSNNKKLGGTFWHRCRQLGITAYSQLHDHTGTNMHTWKTLLNTAPHKAPNMNRHNQPAWFNKLRLCLTASKDENEFQLSKAGHPHQQYTPITNTPAYTHRTKSAYLVEFASPESADTYCDAENAAKHSIPAYIWKKDKADLTSTNELGQPIHATATWYCPQHAVAELSEPRDTRLWTARGTDSNNWCTNTHCNENKATTNCTRNKCGPCCLQTTDADPCPVHGTTVWNSTWTNQRVVNDIPLATTKVIPAECITYHTNPTQDDTFTLHAPGNPLIPFAMAHLCSHDRPEETDTPKTQKTPPPKTPHTFPTLPAREPTKPTAVHFTQPQHPNDQHIAHLVVAGDGSAGGASSNVMTYAAATNAADIKSGVTSKHLTAASSFAPESQALLAAVTFAPDHALHYHIDNATALWDYRRLILQGYLTTRQKLRNAARPLWNQIERAVKQRRTPVELHKVRSHVTNEFGSHPLHTTVDCKLTTLQDSVTAFLHNCDMESHPSAQPVNWTPDEQKWHQEHHQSPQNDDFDWIMLADNIYQPGDITKCLRRQTCEARRRVAPELSKFKYDEIDDLNSDTAAAWPDEKQAFLTKTITRTLPTPALKLHQNRLPEGITCACNTNDNQIRAKEATDTHVHECPTIQQDKDKAAATLRVAYLIANTAFTRSITPTVLWPTDSAVQPILEQWSTPAQPLTRVRLHEKTAVTAIRLPLPDTFVMPVPAKQTDETPTTPTEPPLENKKRKAPLNPFGQEDEPVRKPVPNTNTRTQKWNDVRNDPESDIQTQALPPATTPQNNAGKLAPPTEATTIDRAAYIREQRFWELLHEYEQHANRTTGTENWTQQQHADIFLATVTEAIVASQNENNMVDRTTPTELASIIINAAQLSTEAFSSIFNFNPLLTTHYTNTPSDTKLGFKYDSLTPTNDLEGEFTLANPPYERKIIQDLIDKAERTVATAKRPTRIVAILPAGEKWEQQWKRAEKNGAKLLFELTANTLAFYPRDHWMAIGTHDLFTGATNDKFRIQQPVRIVVWQNAAAKTSAPIRANVKDEIIEWVARNTGITKEIAEEHIENHHNAHVIPTEQTKGPDDPNECMCCTTKGRTWDENQLLTTIPKLTLKAAFTELAQEKLTWGTAFQPKTILPQLAHHRVPNLKSLQPLISCPILTLPAAVVAENSNSTYGRRLTQLSHEMYPQHTRNETFETERRGILRSTTLANLTVPQPHKDVDPDREPDTATNRDEPSPSTNKRRISPWHTRVSIAVLHTWWVTWKKYAEQNHDTARENVVFDDRDRDDDENDELIEAHEKPPPPTAPARLTMRTWLTRTPTMNSTNQRIERAQKNPDDKTEPRTAILRLGTAQTQMPFPQISAQLAAAQTKQQLQEAGPTPQHKCLVCNKRIGLFEAHHRCKDCKGWIHTSHVTDAIQLTNQPLRPLTDNCTRVQCAKCSPTQSLHIPTNNPHPRKQMNKQQCKTLFNAQQLFQRHDLVGKRSKINKNPERPAEKALTIGTIIDKREDHQSICTIWWSDGTTTTHSAAEMHKQITTDAWLKNPGTPEFINLKTGHQTWRNHLNASWGASETDPPPYIADIDQYGTITYGVPIDATRVLKSDGRIAHAPNSNMAAGERHATFHPPDHNLKQTTLGKFLSALTAMEKHDTDRTQGTAKNTTPLEPTPAAPHRPTRATKRTQTLLGEDSAEAKFIAAHERNPPRKRQRKQKQTKKQGDDVFVQYDDWKGVYPATIKTVMDAGYEVVDTNSGDVYSIRRNQIATQATTRKRHPPSPNNKAAASDDSPSKTRTKTSERQSTHTDTNVTHPGQPNTKPTAKSTPTTTSTNVTDSPVTTPQTQARQTGSGKRRRTRTTRHLSYVLANEAEWDTSVPMTPLDREYLRNEKLKLEENDQTFCNNNRT